MHHRVILRAGWEDPLDVLAAFADEPWSAALCSDGREERGRWSYLVRHPDLVVVLAADEAGDGFDRLTAGLGPIEAPFDDGPPFQGGLLGLASYELGARAEPVVVARTAWPDLACARYCAVLAFDHQDRQVLAIGRGVTAGAAGERADEARSWLGQPGPAAWRGPLGEDMAADDGGAYEAAVANVVARIAAGEIFQANIARRWRGRLCAGARPYDLLARLAAQSPAPFAAYLRLDDRALVSNSPERFVRVTPAGGAFHVETRPIKGTAPRGRDPVEDASLAAALGRSAKDRAENVMIVDLMRNDLARVSVAGQVRTPGLFAIETFANVHHLVSTVTGLLKPDLTAVDLLRAAFPPGSVTGAPKIQAMKVIAGLEPPRGPYCGTMFWAGFDGAFDSSVLIRTAVLDQDGEGWRLEARAGAGIVADSDPASERQETEAKIAAILGALNGEVP
jgi:para-aminobenzoate synthetase component 1